MGFLDDYINSGRETPEAINRLKFTKDVIINLVGAEIVYMHIRSRQHAVETSDAFRDQYLELVTVPPMSEIGRCLVLVDELEAVAQIIAPGTPVSKLKNGSISTKDLIRVVGNVRSPRFRKDFLAGAHLVSEKGGFFLWFPAAQSFLSQIRGVPAASISFDDTNHFAIAIQMSFFPVMNEAPALFR